MLSVGAEKNRKSGRAKFGRSAKKKKKKRKKKKEKEKEKEKLEEKKKRVGGESIFAPKSIAPSINLRARFFKIFIETPIVHRHRLHSLVNVTITYQPDKYSSLQG